MLDRIHQCHQYINCLAGINISVWWPDITRDVKHVVAACEVLLPGGGGERFAPNRRGIVIWQLKLTSIMPTLINYDHA